MHHKHLPELPMTGPPPVSPVLQTTSPPEVCGLSPTLIHVHDATGHSYL